MSQSDISNKLDEARKELIKIRAQAAVGTTLKSPKQIRSLKKTIARLLTIKNEKNKKTK